MSEQAADDAAGIANPPSSFLASTLSSTFIFLRPYAPQIVPILVCAFFIPLILAISGFAGYVVWSNLSTKWQSPVYLQYGDGVPPYAQVSLQSLHSQQRYDVSLHLAVPTTEANLALGNFMAILTLSTTSNKTLATVRRSAMVVPQKARWLIGTRNVIDVDIPMLSSFVSGASNIVAHVELGRRDGWKTLGSGQGRELSVVSASLQGIAVPHGIRGVAIRFPLVSAFTASFLFLFILTVIFGTCILPQMLPAPELETDEAETEGIPRRRAGSNSIAFPSYDKPRRKRKSHMRRSISDSGGVKLEESVTDMPPAEEPIPLPQRLRQRSSTKRELEDDQSL